MNNNKSIKYKDGILNIATEDGANVCTRKYGREMKLIFVQNNMAENAKSNNKNLK